MQRRQFLHRGLCLGAGCLIPGVSPSLSSIVPVAASLTEPLQPIWDAAVGGNWDTVRQWLQFNPTLISVTGKTEDYFGDDTIGLFHLAAMSNPDVDFLKYMISLGADVHAKDNDWTPLHAAACLNSRDVVRYLISHGNDVNAKDYYDCTPLYNAAWRNSLDVVQYLISQGGDLNIRDNRFVKTPLHAAACCNTLDVVKYLISHGGDIHVKDCCGQTPLHDAAWRNTLDVVKYLISHDGNLHVKDDVGETPLHGAAWRNSLEVVRYLISLGADVNAKTNNGAIRSALPYLRSMVSMMCWYVLLSCVLPAKTS